MQIDEINPLEVERIAKASEQEKERASYEALINYVVQSASEAQLFGSGESIETARRHLSRTIFS
ncbi:hypothetical protein [Phaeobacter sp.]|uniref:hypothetical protein n=1 Tax=Phaeobacter sp. TaxID=1902409 RepID=UPI0025F5E7CD|nr:hypothetical protein [Phaeobacter sp.]